MPKQGASTRDVRGKTVRTADQPSAFERALAYGIVVFGVLALLGFIVTLCYVALHNSVGWLHASIWQYAFWIPVTALPIAFVLVLALLVTSMVRKAKSRG